MTIDNLYHEGELEAQKRSKATETARKIGNIVSDSISEAAIPHLEKQPMCVVGSIDHIGNVWASMLFGQPGFLKFLNPHQIIIDCSTIQTTRDEILWKNVSNNPQVGLLVIDLDTRRRLRINGSIDVIEKNLLRLDVERTYGNCPKYIQRRIWKYQTLADYSQPTLYSSGEVLTQNQISLIELADTFFVASAHPTQGVDASHRGGYPGFISVIDGKYLRIPDYSGNSMYNTLGNFLSYPHAGLVFPDFASGGFLQLTGRPVVHWVNNCIATKSGENERYWMLEILKWRQSFHSNNFNWDFIDYSPLILR